MSFSPQYRLVPRRNSEDKTPDLITWHRPPLRFFGAVVLAMFFSVAVLVFLGQLISAQTSASYRQLPTVASWATEGVEQTPTVSNPNAVIAQDVCPGYSLSNVQKTARGLTGSLSINGSACNAYGTDYSNLTLTVYYDTQTRLHVTIGDVEQKQYRIPPNLVGIPAPDTSASAFDYSFQYNESPFEFWVTRSDGEVLFDTRGWKLIFETQYLELTTNMEQDYNVYGLGEVIHSLRLGNNFTRTMWAKYAIIHVQHSF
jgi:alpha-glucosidase